jgi:hypothetical protein
MMTVRVYHKTSNDSLASIQQEGLHYGATGTNNQEPHARKTNETLDRLRPKHLVRQNVSRDNCLYCYLLIGDRLLDVDSGQTVPLTQWDPGEDKAGLLLEIDPSIAYVSDLEAYDRLADALERQAPNDKIENLAAQYWQRLLPLSEALERYRLDSNRGRYGRVEVMLTASVPPENITILGSRPPL